MPLENPPTENEQPAPLTAEDRAAKNSAGPSVSASSASQAPTPAEAAVAELQATLSEAVGEIRKSIEEIFGELESIKNFISIKDKGLRRWQDGYDYAKRKELLGEYANWIFALYRIEKHEKDSKVRSEMRNIREIMEISIENFSLECIRPKINDDSSSWRGKIKVDAPLETDDASKDGKIAEVVSYGMLYRTGESDDMTKVVRAARVKVWRKVSRS